MCSGFSHDANVAEGHVVTLRFHTRKQRDTAKDVLLFPVQHYQTHSLLSIRDPSLTLTQFRALLKTVLFILNTSIART